MFCKNCGNKLEDKTVFCTKCGIKIIEDKPNLPVGAYYSPRVPGNGLSIAGMVLGIVGLSFVFLYFVSILDISYLTRQIRMSNSFVFAYAFGVVLVPLALSATGLPLSICGMLKNKNGKNISGIILNSITLVLQLVLFLYIVVTYS